jgi:hypothetical protein
MSRLHGWLLLLLPLAVPRVMAAQGRLTTRVTFALGSEHVSGGFANPTRALGEIGAHLLIPLGASPAAVMVGAFLESHFLLGQEADCAITGGADCAARLPGLVGSRADIGMQMRLAHRAFVSVTGGLGHVGSTFTGNGGSRATGARAEIGVPLGVSAAIGLRAAMVELPRLEGRAVQIRSVAAVLSF